MENMKTKAATLTPEKMRVCTITPPEMDGSWEATDSTVHERLLAAGGA
jgi:hypothetical protein